MLLYNYVPDLREIFFLMMKDVTLFDNMWLRHITGPGSKICNEVGVFPQEITAVLGS